VVRRGDLERDLCDGELRRAVGVESRREEDEDADDEEEAEEEAEEAAEEAATEGRAAGPFCNTSKLVVSKVRSMAKTNSRLSNCA
jgi:hypothetical protein